MKMLLIIYAGPNRSRISRLLDEHGVAGYTEVGTVHGAGSSGRREGTRAWPGGAELTFTVVPQGQVEELTAALRLEAGALGEDERLHAAVLPTDAFF